MFDVVIILLTLMFFLLGLIGALLPVLPGPLFSYLGILVLYMFTDLDITVSELIIYAIITLFVFFSDYFLQFLGIKKMGGGKNAIYGTIVGIFIGFFFSPVGLIFGPFVGAFLGSLIDSQSNHQAFKIAFSAVLGFFFGTLVKLVFAIYVIYIMMNKSLYLL